MLQPQEAAQYWGLGEVPPIKPEPEEARHGVDSPDQAPDDQEAKSIQRRIDRHRTHRKSARREAQRETQGISNVQALCLYGAKKMGLG